MIAKETLFLQKTFAHRSYDRVIVGGIDKEKNITLKTYTFDYDDEDIAYAKEIPTSKLQLKNVSTLKINEKGKLEDTSTASINNTDATQSRSK